MIRYVAGLLFDPTGRSLAVVRKRKPAWQAGRLNAIGGKIEDGETPLQAMEREFAEEAGVRGLAWDHVSTLSGPGFEVHFFSCRSNAVWSVQTMEEEVVFVAAVSHLLSDPDLMSNLPVMISLALDDSGLVKPVTLYDARAAA